MCGSFSLTVTAKLEKEWHRLATPQVQLFR